MKALLIFPLSLALFIACANSNTPASSSVKHENVDKTKLLNLVNDLRKKGCKCGDTYYGPAPALSWSNQLETAASNHSKAMEQKGFFSHDAPDGTTPGDRIKEAGYKWSTYGENIAVGYFDENSVINGWLKSPGHCSNIMSKTFKEMGIGKAGSYWTQTFATK